MNNNNNDEHGFNESFEYDSKFKKRYVAEIRHYGLGKYRIIKDKDSYILRNKVNAQFDIWDALWSKTLTKNKSQSDKDASLNIAAERSNEAKEKQKAIENILQHSLSINNSIDWEALRDKSIFKEPKPEKPSPPPKEPNKIHFEPKFNFFDKIFKSSKEEKIQASELAYQIAIKNWKAKKEDCRLELKKFVQLKLEWEKQRADFYARQAEQNDRINKLQIAYSTNDPNAVLEYCELVLNNSDYPETFPKDFDIDYNAETKTLIVEFTLPSPDQFPSLIEVKYIASKKELKKAYLSETQLFKIYDVAIYNITLRTLHELFEADKSNSIDAIIFNGWVNAINKATGKVVNNCIVSIQVKKTELFEVELSSVDPKACFKSLKGIGSSKLSGITAIQPIAQINKNDKRFVQAQDVANKLNEGSNLAAMDWQDFEHLIREIFEKEFSTNGGEVKVTQASRDGGVDAIAFDPDPIRGGKIVIQAKRYTNTVGVAAVRDLYGTVVNEGATKGILVTTTDYGPDAYAFAKNKPITLMNGANLLYLLEKHGHKARIDIAEAKRLQM
jgi:restriction system protein